MHGDIIPRKKVGDIFVDKVHEELDDKDKIMLPKNAKAKNVTSSIFARLLCLESWL